jgi:hypothetical protein
MSPVRYELGFYIPEDGILHSHRQEEPKILHSGRTVGICVFCAIRADAM